MKQTRNQTHFTKFTTDLRSSAGPRLVLALAIAALSAALTSKAAEAAADAKPEKQAKAAVTSAPSESQVKLLDAGAEPRKKLRLHPKAGDKQTSTTTLKMTMNVQMGDAEGQSMKAPPMKMIMETTVKSVAPNGDINYGTTMSDVNVADDPDAAPQMVEAMKASLGSLKGLSGTGTVSDHGVSKGVDMQIPADADPQARQALEQMKENLSKLSMPLPEQAVGPGAKWEQKTQVKSQGMLMDQTSAYELVSVDGDRLTAKVTITQSAANQKISNPSMGDVKIDLKKMTGKGTGNVTMNLGHLIPEQANVDLHTETSMAMDMGGQENTMSMKMDMNVRNEAK